MALGQPKKDFPEHGTKCVSVESHCAQQLWIQAITMPLWEPTQIPLSLLKFQLSTPTGNTNNIFVNQLSMCFPLGWKACTQEFVQSVQSLLQLHSCLFILLQPQ